MNSRALRISAYTVYSAAGQGRAATLASLRARETGLRANDLGPHHLPTWIGRVSGLETQALPEHLAVWECRNSRLGWRGLQSDGFAERVAQARARYGASRVAV